MESLLTYTKEKGQKKQARRPRRNVRKANNFSYLANTDSRMQFNSSKDPIYFAFEYIENRSIAQLMGDLIQDSFFEITSFISTVIKK